MGALTEKLIVKIKILINQKNSLNRILKCKHCKSELKTTSSPKGTPLYYCPKTFCKFYGKFVEN